MADFPPIHLSIAPPPVSHWTFAITLSVKDDGCRHNYSLLKTVEVFEKMNFRGTSCNDSC